MLHNNELESDNYFEVRGPLRPAKSNIINSARSHIIVSEKELVIIGSVHLKAMVLFCHTYCRAIEREVSKVEILPNIFPS